MSFAPPALPTAPKSVRLATWLTLAVGAAVLALWLWGRFCAFPAEPWNDLRLAPTVALSQGWAVFPTAETGTINTWTYGPLPLLVFWPASWAATAGGAMLVAAALNLALALVPLALVCFAWPARDREADNFGTRAAAFILCVALWPEKQYVLHSADNLAIACGLLGDLLLIRARGPRELWLAAVLAAASVACKQTAAGIAVAQVLWLALTVGWRPGLLHALRCALAGAVIGGLCVLVFGGAELWFILVELPAHFKWAPQPMERLLASGAGLTAQVLLPFAAMALARHWLVRPPLLLPALAWACTLPLGLAALLKFGGRMNSIYSFMLWLPPVATLLLTARWPARWSQGLPLAAAFAAAVIGGVRLAKMDTFLPRPELAAYDEAAGIAARLRGQVWFPLHPLVTLYSERRYYHDEDGFYVRRMTHKAVTPEHATAQLPVALRVMAFHQGWSDWNIARQIMPAGARETLVGHWTLLTAPAPSSP